jgi:two-component system sensor histidine kinase/response regulator
MTDKAKIRGHIMVVDDVEDNHVLLCRSLSRAGYSTVAHDNGVDAIAAISTEPPDLLLLDWMMPGLSGLDVLSAVRERYDANELPIIMCTARDESGSIGQAIEAGANDYLQKPVSMAIAIARITAQLERRAALRALSDMNRDLEEALAQRTRALLPKAAALRPDASFDVQELLRLADWLRSGQASDPVLLSACADSITSAAHRLSAA